MLQRPTAQVHGYRTHVAVLAIGLATITGTAVAAKVACDGVDQSSRTAFLGAAPGEKVLDYLDMTLPQSFRELFAVEIAATQKQVADLGIEVKFHDLNTVERADGLRTCASVLYGEPQGPSVRVDPSEAVNPIAVFMSVRHELQHVANRSATGIMAKETIVAKRGMSRKAFIAANIRARAKDEAVARLADALLIRDMPARDFQLRAVANKLKHFDSFLAADVKVLEEGLSEAQTIERLTDLYVERYRLSYEDYLGRVFEVGKRRGIETLNGRSWVTFGAPP